MDKPVSGTLYGIGVGPGDPDLISVKAVKVLKTVDVVFAASSTKNAHSQAVNIARLHIPQSASVRLLAFPMTRDRRETEAAWIRNAETIVAELAQGRDAAFITLGDAMTYSTYGYLLPHIRRIAPEAKVVTIPGITSYQAAAARINTPLVEGEETLVVLSGVRGGDRLREFRHPPDTVVMLKAYKNVADIADALKECNMDRTSTGITCCGMAGEQIIEDIHELAKRKPGYWTLIIAKRNKENASQ